MSLFIRNLLLFIITCTGAAVVIIFIEKAILARKKIFVIPASAKYIFAGHSHAQAAYYEKIIDSSLNIAAAGESYFYSYIKLKNVLEANTDRQHIVFIEYANNTIISQMNKWIWRDIYIYDKYKLYSPYADFNEIKFLYTHNPQSAFISDARSVINNAYYIISLENIAAEGHKTMGGYSDLQRHAMDSILTALKGKKDDGKPEDTTRSPMNIYYLKKMIDLCRQHNDRVFLVRSPVHPLYSAFRNEANLQHILHTTLKETTFLDFKNYPLMDADFGDLEHLSEVGAKKYSAFFNKLIKMGLLDKTNKQEFIELQMRTEQNNR